MKKRALITLVFIVVGSLTSLSEAATDDHRDDSGQVPHSRGIALLDSANTRLFFGINYPDCTVTGSLALGAKEYERYFLGWAKVLTDAQIPFDVIHDADVSKGGLEDFKVLILSNDVSLAPYQMEAIENWVDQGGHLLATFGSGYQEIIRDEHKVQLRLADGGRGELSEIWHDPFTKLFSSQAIDPHHGVDIQITRSSGPTAGLPIGLRLGYGGAGNILVSRPLNDPHAFGFLVFDPSVNWKLPQPAILEDTYGKGLVVYYAFAPEFLVSLEFDVAGHCPGDYNYYPPNRPSLYAGRSAQLRVLMKATINYLLNGNEPGKPPDGESQGRRQ